MNFKAQMKESREKKHQEELSRKKKLEAAENAKKEADLQFEKRKSEAQSVKIKRFLNIILRNIFSKAYLANQSFSHFDILASSTPFGTSFYLMLGAPSDTGHQFIHHINIPFNILQSAAKLCKDVKYENIDGRTIYNTHIEVPSYTVNCVSSDCSYIAGNTVGSFVFRFVPVEKERLYERYLRRKARAFIKEILLPQIREVSEKAEYGNDVFVSYAYWGNLKYAKKKVGENFKLPYIIKYDGATILKAAKICHIYGIESEVKYFSLTKFAEMEPSFKVEFIFELEDDMQSN